MLPDRVPRASLLAIQGLALYVHVPLCRRKCDYCSFHSKALTGNVGCEASELVSALIDELDSWIAALRACGAWEDGFSRLGSLYVGGGTPTLLPATELGKLVDETLSRLACDTDIEITVEANPVSLSRAHLLVLEQVGATRLSLGIQTLSDRLLPIIGRQGSAARSLAALELVAGHFSGEFGCDLMTDIPGQTPADLHGDIESVASFGPTHLSIYSLMFEERSALAGRLEEPAALPGFIVDEATRNHGFERYELSNFSLPGHECRHNLAYWRLDPFLGLGPSAASSLPMSEGRLLRFERGKRLRVGPDHSEIVSPAEQALELLMLGLRTREGVSQSRFEERLGPSLGDLFAETIAWACAEREYELSAEYFRRRSDARGRISFDGLNELLRRAAAELDNAREPVLTLGHSTH